MKWKCSWSRKQIVVIKINMCNFLSSYCLVLLWNHGPLIHVLMNPGMHCIQPCSKPSTQSLLGSLREMDQSLRTLLCVLWANNTQLKFSTKWQRLACLCCWHRLAHLCYWYRLACLSYWRMANQVKTWRWVEMWKVVGWLWERYSPDAGGWAGWSVAQAEGAWPEELQF